MMSPNPENPLALVNDGLLTVPQAAAFLGVSRAFLYRLMGRGDLAFATIGRTRRVPRRALAELALRCLQCQGHATES